MAVDQGVIRTPLHVHGVRNDEDYRRKHEAALAAGRRVGRQIFHWQASPGAVAFINGGNWIVLCGCGAACSAGPNYSEARCFECGAVYGDLFWPADPGEIEQTLLARPVTNRHWGKARDGRVIFDESVEQLQDDNQARGVAATKGKVL